MNQFITSSLQWLKTCVLPRLQSITQQILLRLKSMARVCSAGFEVMFGDDPPPTLGSPLDLLSYVQDLDLDWQLDEED